MCVAPFLKRSTVSCLWSRYLHGICAVSDGICGDLWGFVQCELPLAHARILLGEK